MRIPTRRAVCALGLLASGCLGGASTVYAQDCFSFPDAYPLVPGNQWSYATGPGAPSQSLTVQNGFTTIGGVGTRAVRTSTGTTSYETNDASGLRIHGRIGTVQNIQVSVTYNPRIARSSPQACVGDTESNNGTATATAAGLGSATLQYSATSAVEARESITVEAGTFDAYRVRWTTRLQGVVLGEDVDETLTETNWFVPGVGPVQQTVTQDGSSTTVGLRSTNVTPPRSQLSLRFIDGGTPPRAGVRHVWAATIGNAGPDAATDARLVIDAPAGSTIRFSGGTDGWSCTHANVQVRCTNPSLPAGRSATRVTVDTIAPVNGLTATISGSVSSATEDPRPDDDTASLSLVLVGGTPPPAETPTGLGSLFVIIGDLLND